jgi:hypothetical protein
VLALAEVAFGVSLDESALREPWPSAQLLPVLEDLPLPLAGYPFRTGGPGHRSAARPGRRHRGDIGAGRAGGMADVSDRPR